MKGWSATEAVSVTVAIFFLRDRIERIKWSTRQSRLGVHCCHHAKMLQSVAGVLGMIRGSINILCSVLKVVLKLRAFNVKSVFHKSTLSVFSVTLHVICLPFELCGEGTPLVDSALYALLRH